MKILALVLSLAVLLSSCAGSTSFLNENPYLEIVAGTTETYELTFEADGSHAGRYRFTATQNFGEGLEIAISPDAADVDGTLELTVTIVAESGLDPDDAYGVFVEAVSEETDTGAGTTIEVDIR